MIRKQLDGAFDTGDQYSLKTLKQRREQNTKVKLVRVYIRDGGKLVVRY